MSYYDKLYFPGKIMYNLISPFMKFAKFISDNPKTIAPFVLLTVQVSATVIRKQSGLNTIAKSYSNENKWFFEQPHIDPKFIQCITRFRSVFGHPYYSEDKLKCQSEKHYFDFFRNVTIKDLAIKSPCYGNITTIRHEDMGDQIEIRPDPTIYPYYKNIDITAIIFHINPDKPFYLGQKLTAGERLGEHYTLDTCSDVAIRNYSANATSLSSAFLYMPPELLSQYGVYPEQMIIPQETRDEFPSPCTNPRDPMPPAKPGGPDDWVTFSNNKPRI